MRRGGRTAAAVLAVLVATALTGCGLAADAPSETHRPPRSPSATSSPTPVARTVVVTIGDSIMAGYGLPAGQNWPTLLGAAEDVDVVDLGCPSAGFVNTGVCGTEYAGLIPQAVAARPDLVLIQSSSNDRGRADSVVAASTAETLSRLRSALPGTPIVGLSTLWGASAWQPAEIASSSAALKAAVEAEGGRFVDIGQPLRGHPEWMQADTIHPTLDGQRAIDAAVRAGLDAAAVELSR